MMLKAPALKGGSRDQTRLDPSEFCTIYYICPTYGAFVFVFVFCIW